jgi:Flp pilus assembly protein TadD/4-amino-4-deoxy-L-arabinose transferase-like glycosyltransferase
MRRQTRKPPAPGPSASGRPAPGPPAPGPPAPGPPAPGPPAPRRFHRRLAWLALAALLLRVIYLLELRGEALVAVPVGDGWQYDEWARRISAGEWLGAQAFYQTPLYPYFLAAIYTAAGHSLMAVRAIQALLGAAACVLLGVAGRRFFSDRVGLIAAGLLAVYPWAVFSDGLIQKSSLDAVLITSVLASLAVFQFRPGWKWLIAAGLALGAFSLNRETGRLLYPVVVFWLLFYFRKTQPLRGRFTWAAAFTAAVAIVILPVAIYNYKASGEFLLSTSQAGPNFYIGNHAGASGIYEPLTPGGGSAERERSDAVRLAEQARGRALSPGEVSDYWLGRSLEYIRSQPGDWLQLTGVKLLLTLNAAEVADTESLDVYAEYSRVLRALSWFDFGLVLPLAVFGIWQSRADWKRLSLLYAILLLLLLSVAVFFVLARYRYPAVAVAMLFAACGVSALAELRWAGLRTAVPGLLLAAVAVLFTHLSLPAIYRDTTLFNVGLGYLKTDKAAEAIPWLQQAVQRAPDDGAAYFALGEAHTRTGQFQQSVDALRNAVRLNPADAEARDALAGSLNNLGTALSARDETSRAITAFRESLALRPDDAPTHNNLGLALHGAGRASEALQEVRAAVRLKPDYAEAHANLALMLEATGALADARTHFDTAVRLQPDHAGIRDSFAAFLERHR